MLWALNRPPRLTGSYRFRENLFGKLVLEVELEQDCVNPRTAPRADGSHVVKGYLWRDARALDMTSAAMRTLVNNQVAD